ncbi:MAG: outer membrane beta-barrel protein [Myxococcales bacterium]
MRTLGSWSLGLIFLACLHTSARAQEADAPARSPAAVSAPEPSQALEPAAAPAHKPPAFRLGAYAEAFYQWNFNRPNNGITNYRGFDNRHDTFTLSNVALDALWDYHDIFGRLTLQVGHTPSTYYMSEPDKRGSSGANASNAALWKYVQQAYLGYRFVPAFEVAAGLFLSPIGPESMAVRDNWNWSRSNLFFGFPFYHTGARATYALTDAWSFTLAAYNGYNSVVDNNFRKSLSTQLNYTSRTLSAQLLYFGGVERSNGSPEGQPWRNLFDAHATWTITDRVSLIGQATSGFEPNRIGRDRWIAGALYARVKLLSVLYLAARGDAFYEHAPRVDGVRTGAIFWPVTWLAEGTGTLDYRPHEQISFRLEYRHDQASGRMYFGGAVGETPDGAYVPNRRAQNTVTIGGTAWF